MSPDLNSLPTSRPHSSSSSTMVDTAAHASARPSRISLSNTEPFRNSPPSPRSPSLSSLQAAATLNANLQRSGSNASPGLERRRSSLIANIHMNDPTMPAPGEMQESGGGSPTLGRRQFSLGTADPNHHRAPSLGQLHQELENEQESQVNRLLYMIRLQQDQLAAIQGQQQQGTTATSTEQSTQTNSNGPDHNSPRSYPSAQPFNRPASLSRQSSTHPHPANAGTSSHGSSPALRPASATHLGPLTEDFLLGGTRDESAFYQAETSNLTRENQMLKQRVRELGKSCYILMYRCNFQI